MEHLLTEVFSSLHGGVIFLIIGLSLLALGKGADLLVDEAVLLSQQWGLPKALIGATVISLGTTAPEATVSVLAAIQGSPRLALGNAVGSILCDTGLIIGLATLIAPLPLNRDVVSGPSWCQLGAGCLLVLACIPFGSLHTLFVDGGHLPQRTGVVFLGLLGIYLWFTVRGAQAREGAQESSDGEMSEGSKSWLGGLKLVLAIAIVVGASWVLIPAVRDAALRLHISPSIIAATLVAFGTSLPELVTAVTAARRGHGELAIGNVIGADILNVLFVAGAAAAVTTGGLPADLYFFQFLFPAMVVMLVVFRSSIQLSGATLRWPVGLVLIGIYLIVNLVSYMQPGEL